MHWDDLRLALAVAEAGTAAKAARRLGVAHTTVIRRLASLDRDAGARLFERAGQRLVPTAAGHALLGVAGDFARRLGELEPSIRDEDRGLEGLVTITTSELLARFVATQLPLFLQRYPAIRLRVRVGAQIHDLARREADVAIRVNPAPDSSLVGRRIGAVDLGIYGNARTASDERAPWVCFDDDLGASLLARWEARHVRKEDVILRTNSHATFIEALRAGVGVGVLPCAFADDQPELVRRGAVLPGVRASVWVLVHPSVQGLPRISAATAFLTERLRSAAARRGA